MLMVNSLMLKLAQIGLLPGNQNPNIHTYINYRHGH